MPRATNQRSDPAISPASQSLRLAALPTAPSIARAFVTQVGAGFGVPSACTETAELLVSELVTNAVRQTGRVDGPPTPLPAEFVAVVSVRVRITEGAVRLEVWDNDPAPAVLAEQSLTSEGGQGLFLVETLSRAWGCYESRRGGKVVWCDVPTDGPEQVTMEAASARPEKSPRTYAPPDGALLERVLMGLRRLGVEVG